MRISKALRKSSGWMLAVASYLTVNLTAAALVFNNRELTNDLGGKIGKFVSEKKITPVAELLKQLPRKSIALELSKTQGKALDNLYSDRVGSVGIIASVHKCNKCPKWHRSGMVTCWVLTEDGVMVTNYYVIEDKTHDGFRVLISDGKVAPVIEILAASKEDDYSSRKISEKVN